MKRAFTLIELLVSMALIAILAGMLMPSVIRAFKASRNRIAWTAFWHNNRMEVFASESANQKALMFVATNSPQSAYKALWGTNFQDASVPAFKP